jgi:hypothetical protein
MKKTMNEIKRFMTTRRVNDALNTRNNSSIASIHDLLLNFSILMFHENNIEHSESWKESFRLLSIQNESVIIDLSSESTKFRSTSIQSYYQDENIHSNENLSSDQSKVVSIIESSHQLDQTTTDSAVFTALIKRERDRSRKFSASIAYISFMFNISNIDLSFIASRAKEIVELLEKECSYQSIKTTCRFMFEFLSHVLWTK